MIHARNDYNNRVVDLEEKIPEDEPVFLLRGQDIFTETMLNKYANLLEQANGDPKIVKQIRDHVILVRNWKKKKICDLPNPANIPPKTGNLSGSGHLHKPEPKTLEPHPDDEESESQVLNQETETSTSTKEKEKKEETQEI